MGAGQFFGLVCLCTVLIVGVVHSLRPFTPEQSSGVALFVVDRPGFEPGASGLQSRRSPRLSYRPTIDRPNTPVTPRTDFLR